MTDKPDEDHDSRLPKEDAHLEALVRDQAKVIQEIARKLNDHGVTGGDVVQRVSRLCSAVSKSRRSLAEAKAAHRDRMSRLHAKLSTLPIKHGSVEERVDSLVAHVAKEQREHAATRELLREARGEAERLSEMVLNGEQRSVLAILQGVEDVLDRAKVPREGSAEDRVAKLVRHDATVQEVGRIFSEAGFTKGTVESRAHEIVGKLAAHGEPLREARGELRAMGEAQLKAEASEAATRERMAKLGDELLAKQRLVHALEEQLAKAQRVEKALRGSVKGLLADEEVMDQHTIAMDKERDAALEHVRALEAEVHRLKVGESTGLAGQALVDARLGRAVRELRLEIERMRAKGQDTTMVYGFGHEDVARAVASEAYETMAEIDGSISAKREAAGTFAVALHLLLVHGADPLTAITEEAQRLRDRNDWRDAGAMWGEAKSRLAKGHRAPLGAKTWAKRTLDELRRVVPGVLAAELWANDHVACLYAHVGRATPGEVSDFAGRRHMPGHTFPLQGYAYISGEAFRDVCAGAKTVLGLTRHAVLSSDPEPPKAPAPCGPLGVGDLHRAAAAEDAALQRADIEPRWAFVEVMGHQRFVGKLVAEHDGERTFEIEDAERVWTKTVSRAAVFSLTYVSEAEAGRIAESLRQRYDGQAIDPMLLERRDDDNGDVDNDDNGAERLDIPF